MAGAISTITGPTCRSDTTITKVYFLATGFGFSEKQNLSQVNQDVAIFKAISNLVQQTDLKLLNAIKDIDLKPLPRQNT
jgi:hypothetical protein